MTNDIISRQAVMDATKAVMKDILDSLPTTLVDGEEVYDVRTSELDFILNINKALQNAIKALPSVNNSGHWIDDGDCSICSKCHETYGLTLLGQLYTPNFCPNCGADMRGGDDD